MERPEQRIPRKQTEDVNQSARQVAVQERDDARRPAGDRKRREQGIVKDQRGDLQPTDRKRAQRNR